MCHANLNKVGTDVCATSLREANVGYRGANSRRRWERNAFPLKVGPSVSAVRSIIAPSRPGRPFSRKLSIIPAQPIELTFLTLQFFSPLESSSVQISDQKSKIRK